MRIFISVSLLFTLLFGTALALASADQTYESEKLPCLNPEVVAFSASRPIFPNPHSGWLTGPVEEKIVRCPVSFYDLR